MKPSTRPYHHGNLRQALLRAAEAALEARGVQQLSLRELSRELGVSHSGMRPELRTALRAAFSHIPKILKEGQAAGKIIAGDPDRLALTLGAALHGLVAMSIDGKIKGQTLKAIAPEIVQNVLNGLSTEKT